MKIDFEVTANGLSPAIDRFWKLSGEKILAIEKNFDKKLGTPVFTVNGRYSTRGWTEWTQGFQYGCAILTYDATDDNHLHFVMSVPRGSIVLWTRPAAGATVAANSTYSTDEFASIPHCTATRAICPRTANAQSSNIPTGRCCRAVCRRASCATRSCSWAS